MRIISSFRDYYDGVQAHGQDHTLVYVRETEMSDVQFDPLKKFRRDFAGRYIYGSTSESPPHEFKGLFPSPNPAISAQGISFDIVPIGFCGRLYFGWKPTAYTAYRPNATISYEDLCSRMAFSPDGILRLLDLRGELSEKAQEQFESRSPKKVKYLFGPPYLTRASMTEWFEKNPQGFKLDDELFRQAKAPVLIRTTGYQEPPYWRTLINPSLTKLGFMQVIPPAQAFQDLAGYMDGVLGRDAVQTITISDRDQIVKKGFDLKTSFRQSSPGQRKARRTQKNAE